MLRPRRRRRKSRSVVVDPLALIARLGAPTKTSENHYPCGCADAASVLDEQGVDAPLGSRSEIR
jgi:hypothetical protein